jgi:hypothetical protein
MILKDVVYRSSFQARIIPDGFLESEALVLSDKEEVFISDATIAWTKEVWMGIQSTTANLNLATGEGTTTQPSILQVETATLVAAGGITANGSLMITISGTAPFFATPLVFSVPVTTAITTATALAIVVRNHLQTVSGAAGETLRSRYAVGGSGATFSLTPKSGYVGNVDAALNIAIAGGLGVTAAPTSANTTAGYLGVIWKNGPAVDARGIALPVSTETRFCKITCTKGAFDLGMSAGILPIGFVFLTPGQSVTLSLPLSQLTFTNQIPSESSASIVYIGL